MNYKKLYELCRTNRHCKDCPYSIESKLKSGGSVFQCDLPSKKFPYRYDTYEEFKKAIIEGKLKQL